MIPQDIDFLDLPSMKQHASLLPAFIDCYAGFWRVTAMLSTQIPSSGNFSTGFMSRAG